MTLVARIARLEARRPASSPRTPYLILVGCGCSDAPHPTPETLRAIGADVQDGRVHIVPGIYHCPRCAAGQEDGADDAR